MRPTRARRLKHESHDGFRNAMRLIGPVLILVGAGMFIAGVVSFGDNFDDKFDDVGGKSALDWEIERVTGKQPQKPKPANRFWMCFVGIPLLGIGIGMTRAGYLGVAARYVAGETAPVARDTINYVVDGTKDSIRDVAEAIRGDADDAVVCPKCEHRNDADAKFCDDCGAALAVMCAKCGEANDADAKFCSACGTAVS